MEHDDANTLPGGGVKLAVIGPLAFLASLAQGNLGLGLVFHVRATLGASRAEAGLVAGVWFLCYMLSCHLTRPLSKRLRPRFCVFGATLSLAIFAFLLSRIRTLGPAYALNALLGTATAFFWPPLMGWLAANAEGARLSRRLGVFNICWSSGAVLSPMVAGRAFEVASHVPLLLSSGFFLVACLLVGGAICSLPSLRVDDDAHERERRPDGVVASGTPFRFPAWIGLFAVYVVTGVLLNVYPLVASEEMGMVPSRVGDLLFWRAVATSLALGCMGRLKWWHFVGWQMVAGTALMGGAMLVVATTTQNLGVLGIALAAGGAALGVNYVNSIFHGAVGSSHRAARMAVHESLLSAGLCLGAALGGVVFQLAGGAALLFGCAGFLGLAAAVQLAVLRRVAR